MKYRRFGGSGFSVSALGFGCMRLPVENRDPGAISQYEAIGMIRHSLDNGVTYVDTAYNYHRGESEGLVGRALAGRRDNVTLATKLPLWLCDSPDDFERILTEQLDRLGTDYVDCYLLHSLNKGLWDKAHSMGILDFLERELERGRIRHAGFSFHDSYDVFTKIVDAYDWEFCQIMLNYVDTHYQAGVAGLEYAARKGLAVVIMEPLRGGKLTVNLPEEIAETLDAVGEDWSPAEWGLRWVLNRPEVSVVLSGMSSMAQVEENLRVASQAEPGSLSDKHLNALELAREIYLGRMKISCTECGYCQPCPSRVAIPDIFSIYNDAAMFNAVESSTRFYKGIVQSDRGAARCVECGHCESVCPQQLPVTKLLKEAHEALTQS